MNTVFCYNCLSEIDKDFILLRCRNRDCTKPGCEHNKVLKAYRLIKRKSNTNKSGFLAGLILYLRRAIPDISDNIESDIFDVECLDVNSNPKFDLACPNCRRNINSNLFFNDPQKIVPIFGGPFSGKTVLIRNIIHNLAILHDRVDKYFGIFNKEGRKYIEAIGGFEDNFISSLPGRTHTRTPPIILNNGTDYRIIYDIPSDWLAQRNKWEENIHIFSHSPVIIVIIDPCSLPKLRRYMTEIPKSLVDSTLRLNGDDIVINLIDTFNNTTFSEKKDRIPASLYIILSKIDLLMNLKHFHPNAEFREINKKLLSFLHPKADRTSLNEIMESWLRHTEVGLAPLILNAKKFFLNVQYFPISALGEPPLIFEDKRRGEDGITSYSIFSSQNDLITQLSNAIFSIH